MKIYIDLDGVLINIHERWARIYEDLTKKFEIKESLPKKTYLKLKKGLSEEEILQKLKLNKNIIKKYINHRIKIIESEKYLKYDKLMPGVIQTLKKLKDTNKLILVTKRRSRRNLLKQMKILNIKHFFDDILIADKSKYEFLQNKLNKNSVLIGDTEEDILAGKKLKVETIAVYSGSRSKSFLKSLNPDYIVKDVSKVLEVIKLVQSTKLCYKEK